MYVVYAYVHAVWVWYRYRRMGELMIVLNLFQVPDRLLGKGEQACVMDVDTHLRGGKMDNH